MASGDRREILPTTLSPEGLDSGENIAKLGLCSSPSLSIAVRRYQPPSETFDDKSEVCNVTMKPLVPKVLSPVVMGILMRNPL